VPGFVNGPAPALGLVQRVGRCETGCQVRERGLPLLAAGYPADGRSGEIFGILLSPIIAAAAMALSSVSVIANASRLRATKL
jgi:Cation transport ATPase